MTVLIQDSARNNIASWGARAIESGIAQGVILSPFCSPRNANGYHRSPEAVQQTVSAAGGQFWFDAGTHVLQMPSVGDYRFYDDWQLWSGTRGDLSSPGARRDHVAKVFATQRMLGAPLLGPTILLHSAQSSTSVRAIDLGRAAQEAAHGGEFWLSIVGDSQFWASGSDLDGFIGEMDQLEPTGWILSVARPLSVVPVAADPNEVAGLMRTTVALSQNASVVVGHGDVAALPAAAAGAVSLGTGWDVRQRVLAYPDFAERAPSEPGSGGSWYARPTLVGLLGNILPNEFSVLRSQRPTLAERLYSGPHNPQAEPIFQHHAQVLNSVMAQLGPLPLRQRVERLRDEYRQCLLEWPTVQELTGSATAGDQWIGPLLSGVDTFIASEGWA
jgi:hypothetical protein